MNPRAVLSRLLGSPAPARRRCPPKLAEWALFEALPPGPQRDSIVGDLHEEFEERREAGGARRRLAVVWYWLQALRLRRHFSRSWHPPSAGGCGADAPRPEARMNRWTRDARYALNSLRRAPGFAALVILTLGIGIGANVAIFSVVDGVLLTPLAYPEAERLITIWGASARGDRHPIPAGDFEDLRLKADLFRVAAHWTNTGSLAGESLPQEVVVAWVDPNYFEVLGLRAAHGRLLEAADEDNAIVLSDGIWRRFYGADPDIVGDFIQLDGNSIEVVGVLAASPNPNVPSAGQPAPAAGPWLDLAGKSRSLLGLRGEPALLLFFSPEDPAGLDRIVRACSAARTAGLPWSQMLAFGLDDDQAALARAAKRKGLSMPIVPSRSGFLDPTVLRYGVTAVPATYLIGADGTLLARDLPPDRLRTVLSKLLPPGTGR